MVVLFQDDEDQDDDDSSDTDDDDDDDDDDLDTEPLIAELTNNELESGPTEDEVDEMFY